MPSATCTSAPDKSSCASHAISVANAASDVGGVATPLLNVPNALSGNAYDVTDAHGCAKPRSPTYYFAKYGDADFDAIAETLAKIRAGNAEKGRKTEQHMEAVLNRMVAKQLLGLSFCILGVRLQESAAELGWLIFL